MKHLLISAFLVLGAACAGAPPLVVPPDWAPNAPVGAVAPYRVGNALCSSVAISSTLALTAAHCMDEAGRLGTVQSVDRAEAREVVWTEWFEDWGRGQDIAVLEVNAEHPFAEWADTSTAVPNPGDPLTIVGYCPTASARVRPARAGILWQGEYVFFGEVCGGDSGGGLFNAAGELIGANVRTNGDGIGVATPVAAAAPLLERFDD